MTTCLTAGRQVTVDWIAERLGMGTRGHLNHLLQPATGCAV
jgi:hypothetical protein